MDETPDAERALALYRTMARIRAFEDAAEEASKGGVAAFGASLAEAKVRGPLHLSTGQEAVAAGIPIAVGAAHALRARGTDDVVACFFGDGAINRGPFLEGLNWAAVHRLAILFVCEDNRWAATTASEATTAGAGAPARAEAIGVPGTQVDGNDVFAVWDAAGQAGRGRDRAQRARRHGGDLVANAPRRAGGGRARR